MSGNTFTYDDGYGAIVDIEFSFNGDSVWSGNTFIDKKTAQDIVTPTETTGLIIADMANAIHKTAGFTKL